MHAWEAIQKTLNHIEEHLGEEVQIEELAEIAVLSLFYYQRLFTRLVKTSVRDYIKLRDWQSILLVQKRKKARKTPDLQIGNCPYENMSSVALNRKITNR